MESQQLSSAPSPAKEGASPRLRTPLPALQGSAARGEGGFVAHAHSGGAAGSPPSHPGAGEGASPRMRTAPTALQSQL